MPITTLFIDLDDTLYPASSGLWTVLRGRIGQYMVERLGIPVAEADHLRRVYFETYGTALRGLEINCPLDRQDFLAYVHDVNLREYIGPDPILRAALDADRHKRFIFTNADTNHAKRVTAVLGVADCFDGMIDTNAIYPFCKPERAALERALAISGESDPRHCALIDDLPHNVRAAREFGMKGILFGSGVAQNESGDPVNIDADAVFDDWSKLGEVLAMSEVGKSNQCNHR
jgi:putative hydrolase of the HAD superfamily